MGYKIEGIMNAVNKLNEKKRIITADRIVDLLDFANCVVEQKVKVIEEKMNSAMEEKVSNAIEEVKKRTQRKGERIRTKRRRRKRVCVVCLSQTVDTMLLPCGHMALFLVAQKQNTPDRKSASFAED
eukprot:TRINITY_DN5869_c0_g1_i2.p2 TRINITY_DN5869_c0_g1~~TRINITY_DN5869_c0_g1_i2.p2  ORF type:complete len:127 (+),score=31.89 TRINITY_DN5869_c0_g1_i2:970-1350(+)